MDALEAADVRVELDDRAEKLGYRMREGQVEKYRICWLSDSMKKTTEPFPSVCMAKKKLRFCHWILL